MTHRDIEIVPCELPDTYAWADDATGAADMASSVEEARAQIDAALDRVEPFPGQNDLNGLLMGDAE